MRLRLHHELAGLLDFIIGKQTRFQNDFHDPIIGCLYLFISLGTETKLMFVGWAAVGLVVYFAYSRSRSYVGRGIIDTHERDEDIPPQPVPPMPGAHTPGGRDA